MKILVTGGGGFIGSALLLWIPSNYKVVSLDLGENYSQLQSLVGDNVIFVKGDITDIKLVDDLMKDTDIVIHLAGIVGDKACMSNPNKAVLTNIYGTYILLQKAIKYEIDRFIFASTQSVYTTFRKRPMPLKEDMKPEPDDFYGALKSVSEYEIMDFIDYVILRFSNIYGYGSGLGAQWGGVIGRFIKSADEKSEIAIYGSGDQGVDFVHIDDLLQAILKIIETPEIRKEIFNIGSNRIAKIRELAQIVADCFKEDYNRNIILKKVEAPPGKIWPDRWLANDRIRKLLPPFPTISLKQGIRQLVKKYMEANQ